MNYDELKKMMAQADDFEIDVTKHVVHFLRSLADKVEAGTEVNLSALVKVSRDKPGKICYEIINQK